MLHSLTAPVHSRGLGACGFTGVAHGVATWWRWSSRWRSSRFVARRGEGRCNRMLMWHRDTGWVGWCKGGTFSLVVVSGRESIGLSESPPPPPSSIATTSDIPSLPTKQVQVSGENRLWSGRIHWSGRILCNLTLNNVVQALPSSTNLTTSGTVTITQQTQCMRERSSHNGVCCDGCARG